jgi:hypothetical protein
MQSSIEISPDDMARLERGQALRTRANSGAELVLVLAEQYEKLKELIQVADFDPKSVYSGIASIDPDDWEDLSAYPNAEKL